MKKISLAVFILFLYHTPSFAQDKCNSAVSDAEINACYNSAKVDAEKALNSEYGNAKKRINEEYSSSPSDLDSYTKILTESQRGWLKYRDGQCELEAYLAEKGTVTHDTLYNKCISRIDMDRTSQLKSIPYE